MNHTPDDLTPLDRIARVDAPPFLLTRIRQRIDESNRTRISPPFQWVIGITVILFLAINTIAILKVTQKTESTPVLAQGMNLVPTSIYNE
ncbi:MAG: hypothetical protein U0264_09535 [Candidatus Kapaibacterium sp.]